MGKIDKLKERFKSQPKDFTFDELVSMLSALGFVPDNKGKTSGSRVKFTKNDSVIILHKPHPGNELKEYQLKQILQILESEGLI